MDDIFTTREYGWTECNGSKNSSDPLVEETKLDSGSSGDQDIPFSRHGPIIDDDLADLANQKEF